MQPLEPSEGRRVQGIDAEDLLIGRRAAVRVLELLGPDAGNALELGDLRLHRVMGGHAPLLGLRDLLPHLLAPVDALERVDGLVVSGPDVEGVHVGVRRIHRLLELRVVEAPELHEDALELGLLEERGPDMDHAMERIDELRVLVAGAVDVRDAEERLGVLRVEIEDALPVVEGVPRALEVRVPDVTQVREDAHAGLVVLHDGGLALEHLDEIGPALALGVQRAQRVQRLRILAPQVEDLLPEPDGLLRLAELVRRQAGHVRQDVGPCRVAEDDVELLLEGTVEAREVALTEVDALERFHGLGVFGLELRQNVLVGQDGFVRAPEIHLEDSPAPVVELDQICGQVRRVDAEFQRRGESLVGAGLRVEPVEGQERVLVPRVDADHEAIRLLGPQDVAELLLVHAREPLAEVGPRRRLLGAPDAVRVGTRELAPPAHGLGEPLGFREAVVVARILEDRSLHPQERPLVVERLLLRQLGDAVHALDTLRHVLLVRELDLLDREQLLPALLQPVKRLEDLADAHRMRAPVEDALEGPKRRAMLGSRAQDRLVERDGPGHVAEPGLVHLAQAELEVEHGIRARGELDLPLEHARELLPLPGLQVEPVEGLEGLELTRIGARDERIAGDGRGHVAEVRLVERRHPKREVDDLIGSVPGELRDLFVVERDHLRPSPEAFGEALEARERVVVAAVEGQRPGVGLEGRRRVRERVLLKLGDAVQQLHLPERVLLVRDLHLVHGHEPRHVAGRLVGRLEHGRRREGLLAGRDDALERRERRLVRRLNVEDVAVDLHRTDRLAQPVVPKLRDAVAIREHLHVVRRQIRLTLEDAHQVLPGSGGLVELVQAAQRRVIVRVDLQDALVAVDGPRRVLQLLLVDRAHLDVEALLFERIEDDVRLARVHLEERLPGLGAEVELDQLVDARHVLGVDLENLVMHAHRVVRTLEHLLVEACRAMQRVLLLVDGGQHGRLRQRDGGEVLVALAQVKEALEALGGVEVRVVELEHLAVVPHGPLVIPELLLADLRGLHVEARGHLRILDALDLRLVGRRELLRVSDAARESLELRLRGLARRVLAQRPRIRVEGLR